MGDADEPADADADPPELGRHEGVARDVDHPAAEGVGPQPLLGLVEEGGEVGDVVEMAGSKSNRYNLKLNWIQIGIFKRIKNIFCISYKINLTGSGLLNTTGTEIGLQEIGLKEICTFYFFLPQKIPQVPSFGHSGTFDDSVVLLTEDHARPLPGEVLEVGKEVVGAAGEEGEEEEGGGVPGAILQLCKHNQISFSYRETPNAFYINLQNSVAAWFSIQLNHFNYFLHFF